MIPLVALNGATREEFVALLGAVFEHSPWAAEQAYDRRPFATRDLLHAAMTAVVAEVGPQRQLALLRAHPELAGQAAMHGQIAKFSSGSRATVACSRVPPKSWRDCGR